MLSSASLLTGRRRLVDRMPQALEGSPTRAWYCSCVALTNSGKEMPHDQERGSAMILALMLSVKTKHIRDGFRLFKNPKMAPPCLTSTLETHVYSNVGGKNLLSRM